MEGIVRLALRRPYTFVVLAILILIFGSRAAVRTPTDIFPNIGIPVISVVRRNVPGAFVHHLQLGFTPISHALVQLLAGNPDGKLWPGAFTTVHFHIPSDPNVLRIPVTALIFSPQGMQVAKVDEENKVVLSKVRLGRNLGNYVEVSSGVSLSDRLVNCPQEDMAVGETVRIAGARDQGAAARPMEQARALGRNAQDSD